MFLTRMQEYGLQKLSETLLFPLVHNFLPQPIYFIETIPNTITTPVYSLLKGAVQSFTFDKFFNQLVCTFKQHLYSDITLLICF